MFPRLSAKEYKILSRELFVQDDYCLQSLRDKPVSVIIDIGANVGLFSLYARALFPQARIIAFEPDGDNYIALEALVEHINVETYQIALGDGEPVEIKPDEKFPTTGLTTQSVAKGIPSRTLPQIFSQLKIDPHQNVLLKIDCESAEKHIYNDPASEEILNAVRQWAMEIHFGDKWPDNYNHKLWNEWLDKMQGDGYLHRRLIKRYQLGTVVKRNY